MENGFDREAGRSKDEGRLSAMHSLDRRAGC